MKMIAPKTTSTNTMAMPTLLALCSGSLLAGKAYAAPPPYRMRIPTPGPRAGIGRHHRSLQQMIQISAQLSTDSNLDDGGDDLSFLSPEEEKAVPSSCPTACDSKLCACVDRHGEEESNCAAEIQNVCSSSTIDQCIPTEFVDYFESLFCPYAECIMIGKSAAQCNCDFHWQYCDLYDDEASVVSCDVASCCMEQSDDAGRNECLDGSLISPEYFEWADSTSNADPTRPSLTLEMSMPKMALMESEFNMSVAATTSVNSSSSPSKSPTKPTHLVEPADDALPVDEIAMSMALVKELSSMSMTMTEQSRPLIQNAMPSSVQSAQPSISPSLSGIPSGEPSLNPSVSDWPTSHPSIGPSVSSEPSSKPSSKPSLAASNTPSASSQPSTHPSSRPSSQPSSQPSSSKSPTPAPTHLPTPVVQTPTHNPSTAWPSYAWPSYLPTNSPTMMKLTQNEFTLEPDSKAAKTTYIPTGEPSTRTTPAISLDNTTEEPTNVPTATTTTRKTPTVSPSLEGPPTEASSTQNPTADSLTDIIIPVTSPPTAAPTTIRPSSTPTSSPTKAPTLPVINVETSIQLQLEDLSAEMDEATNNVFESSCEAFLNDMLASAIPPVYDVECVVTNQQLLSGQELIRRRLSTRGGGRRIQEEAENEPLLVSVTVKGSVTSTSTVVEPSDIPFDDLVYGTFAANSAVFVNQLRDDGNAVGIDDFEDLTTVYAIKQVSDKDGGGDGHSSSNPDGAKNPDGIGSGNGDGNDDKMKKGAIASIVISGVVVVAMFGMLFYHVSKKQRSNGAASKNEEAVASEFVDDVYVDSLLKNAHSVVEDLSSDNIIGGGGGSGSGENEDLTYHYSLDDGLASPQSLVSQAVTASPANMSLTDQLLHQMTQWMDTGNSTVPNRIKKDIIAPPGKLGIIIDTCSEGPVVHSVKPSSPLVGLIFKGDLVVAVDDEDTREWSAHYLTKLVAKKSKCERKISVMRPEVEVAGEEENMISMDSMPTGDDGDGQKKTVIPMQ